MFKRFPAFGSAFSALRAASLFAVPALGAYVVSARPTFDASAPGEIELTTTPASASSCDRAARPAAGRLELRSLDGRNSVSISERELGASDARRRAMAPGLYAVSWVSEGDAIDPRRSWMLREPKLISVLPGKVVALRVSLDVRCGPELARRDP